MSTGNAVQICTGCSRNNRAIARYCRYCGAKCENAAAWMGVVGLSPLRAQLDTILTDAAGLHRRLAVREPLHMCFLGAPGSGKSHIGMAVVREMHSRGLIQKPVPRVFRGAEFQNALSDLTTHFHDNRGGVLLIDDAHMLVNNGTSPAFDRLYLELQAAGEVNDPVILVTGQAAGLKAYLASSQLGQRIPHVFELPSLTCDEMAALAERFIGDQSLSVSTEAYSRLRARFRYLLLNAGGGEDLVRRANAHLVRREVLAILKAYARRKDARSVIEPEEIEGEVFEDKTVEEVLAELEFLVGMKSVRQYLETAVTMAQVKRRESEATGQPFAFADHIMLTGNPGTGKTTLARTLGRLFSAAGFVDSGHVVEVDRGKMVAQHTGGTAPLVHGVCDAAIGGVLFIDEAYTLKQSDNDSFGQEAIDTLMKRMEDDRGRFVVVAAGYRDRMLDFLEANPGLESRFKRENILHIDDYTPDELTEIFERMVVSARLALVDDARDEARNAIRARYFARGRNWGNAREVRNFFEACEKRRGMRVRELTELDLTLRMEDIPGAGIKDRASALAEARAELDAMVGLTSVKRALAELADYMEMQELVGKADGAPGLSLHFTFRGNPGTGKTTIARLLGRILSVMGIVPSGHVIEANRDDLVAGYVGQTARKTNAVVDRAIGGILFIDEAYTLLKSGETNDFGLEAINALLTRMENDRGKFIVIAAGYDKQMERFLAANEGLPSRFTQHIYFEDYSAAEMGEIFVRLAESAGEILADGVAAAATTHFEHVSTTQPAGNGRTVRNFYERALVKRASRLAALHRGGTDVRTALRTIMLEDLPLT